MFPLPAGEGEGEGLFPQPGALTPALSQWEREKTMGTRSLVFVGRVGAIEELYPEPHRVGIALCEMISTVIVVLQT
jgi:hypothetical protein